MKPLYVAIEGDGLAEEAIKHLENQFECQIAFVKMGEMAPSGSIAFFTSQYQTSGGGWTGGRHSALVKLPEVPEWAKSCIFLVALRPNTGGNFKKAVEWAARVREKQIGLKTPLLWEKPPKKPRVRTRAGYNEVD